MSNALSIMAVTATLRNILSDAERGIPADNELEDIVVTTKSLDKARANDNNNQANIFLYHTGLSAAWRNMPIPGQVRSGELGVPPLPLNLYYVVTAYGRGSDELLSHRILGRAMRTLYDTPRLRPEALKAALPESDLYQQLEPIHVTMQNFTIDEMHRLWTAFQAPYRPSIAYQIGVILIESRRPTISSPPTLGTPSRTTTSPQLDALEYPKNQESTRLGESVGVTGRSFSTSPKARLLHRATRREFTVSPQSSSGSTLVLTFEGASGLLAGLYSIAIETSEGTRSNELQLLVAPKLSNIRAEKRGPKEWQLSLQSEPAISSEQRVSLFLGSQEFLPNPIQGTQRALGFQLTGLEPGEYRLRLRVDGVDSWLIDKSQSPPVYDNSQAVRLP